MYVEIEQLREELVTTQEHLQTLLEQQEATYEELRQSGGYVEVQPPAPGLPTLPEGQPVEPNALLGAWQGKNRSWSIRPDRRCRLFSRLRLHGSPRGIRKAEFSR